MLYKVWVLCEGSPWWPARIVQIPEYPLTEGSNAIAQFYGTGEITFIDSEDTSHVTPFFNGDDSELPEEHRDKLAAGENIPEFVEAVNACLLDEVTEPPFIELEMPENVAENDIDDTFEVDPLQSTEVKAKHKHKKHKRDKHRHRHRSEEHRHSGEKISHEKTSKNKLVHKEKDLPLPSAEHLDSLLPKTASSDAELLRIRDSLMSPSINPVRAFQLLRQLSETRVGITQLKSTKIGAAVGQWIEPSNNFECPASLRAAIKVLALAVLQFWYSELDFSMKQRLLQNDQYVPAENF